jgi:hypothetical protein
MIIKMVRTIKLDISGLYIKFNHKIYRPKDKNKRKFNENKSFCPGMTVKINDGESFIGVENPITCLRNQIWINE